MANKTKKYKTTAAALKRSHDRHDELAAYALIRGDDKTYNYHMEVNKQQVQKQSILPKYVRTRIYERKVLMNE